MASDPNLEQDIENEEKPEERQRPEPAANVKGFNRTALGEIGTVPDQDAPDEEAAQDKKKFDPIKPAMPEHAKPGRHLRIEQAEAMSEKDARNSQCAKAIQAEDSRRAARLCSGARRERREQIGTSAS